MLETSIRAFLIKIYAPAAFSYFFYGFCFCFCFAVFLMFFFFFLSFLLMYIIPWLALQYPYIRTLCTYLTHNTYILLVMDIDGVIMMRIYDYKYVYLGLSTVSTKGTYSRHMHV
ncbi:hypothetical protein DFH27DRAFT_331034 [Peziza echinospora]|nr:hypothetical protein DFH27DRAFT_331034 [Peziza echinospora]